MYYFSQRPIVWAVTVNSLFFVSAPICCLRVVKYDHLCSCFQPNDNTSFYFLWGIQKMVHKGNMLNKARDNTAE